jgi:hypothetical protein
MLQEQKLRVRVALCTVRMRRDVTVYVPRRPQGPFLPPGVLHRQGAIAALVEVRRRAKPASFSGQQDEARQIPHNLLRPVHVTEVKQIGYGRPRLAVEPSRELVAIVAAHLHLLLDFPVAA